MEQTEPKRKMWEAQRDEMEKRKKEQEMKKGDCQE